MCRTAGATGNITIRVTDAAGNPLNNIQVELRLWTPANGANGWGAFAPAGPNDLFSANQGVTNAAGEWTCNVQTGASRGVTVRGIGRDPVGGNWFPGTIKIVLVGDTVDSNPGGQGCRVYYSSAAGDPHTPAAGYAARIAQTLEDARDAYNAWGFRALAYTDSDNQRFVIFNLEHIRFWDPNADNTGVCYFKGVGGDDSLIHYNIGLSTAEARPNSFADHIAAHELLHMFQCRYGRSADYADQKWLFESTADWAPGRAFPDNDQYIYRVCNAAYPGAWFPILDTNSHNWLDDSHQLYAYTRAVFFKHLVDHDFSAIGPQFVERTWDRFRLGGTGIEAVQGEIAACGSDLPTSFGNFAYDAWIQHWDDVICQPDRRGTSVLAIPGQASEIDIPLNHLSPAYWRFDPNAANARAGTFRIAVSGATANQPLPNADNVWRARLIHESTAGAWALIDVPFTVLDPATNRFGGAAAIPGFGPAAASGSVVVSGALAMSNVTFQGNAPAVPAQNLLYSFWASLE